MVSDEKLIEDLQDLAEKIGEVPTVREMRESGPWSGKTYQKYFGSWNDALKEAGLETNMEMKCVKSKEKLIEDLQDLAEKLGKTPTQREMNKSGPWDYTTYKNHFSSWNEALEEAGLETDRTASKEQLIEDLQDFAEKLGKTPRKVDMNERGPWDGKTYRDHFGTWNEALEKAGFDINRLGSDEIAGTGEQAYGAGWIEARRETLERDDYTCQVCEVEDKSNHVHHIKPRREFDDVSDSNTDNNLITLCSSCHSHCEGRWTDCDPDEFAERATEMLM